MKYLVIVVAIFLVLSCQKEKDNNSEFSFLNIEETYGLVLGTYVEGTDTTSKIFKLNKSDNLEEIKYLQRDRREIEFNRIPVAIYNLNGTHFLLTFKYGSQNTLESYVVRRFDGKAYKVPKAVNPEHLGKLDLRNNIIRHDNKLGFYFSNSKGNWKLDLSNEQNPKISEILKGEELGDNYVVDYLGNIISDKKVYSVNEVITLLKNSNISYSIPVESFINSMYYIFRNGDSIKCSKIDVSSDISETTLATSFKLTTDEAVFIGSHAFPQTNKIWVILSKAILQIDGNSIQKINIEDLQLSRVNSFYSNGNYCFIYGENAIKEKIFVRIDPHYSNPVFTQILAPEEVDITHFSISSTDNLMFTGLRLKDSKKLFGFIPFNGNNWIIDDDKGIVAIQVMVL